MVSPWILCLSAAVMLALGVLLVSLCEIMREVYRAYRNAKEIPVLQSQVAFLARQIQPLVAEHNIYIQWPARHDEEQIKDIGQSA